MEEVKRKLSEVDFAYRTLSLKRCEEINNMKIRCPWRGYENDYYKINENRRCISDVSESIIYDKAFHYPPMYNEQNDYYVIIYETEYHLFRLNWRRAKERRCENIIYQDMVYVIFDAESIDCSSNKETILYALSRIITATRSKCQKLKNRTEIFNVSVEYKGKSIK